MPFRDTMSLFIIFLDKGDVPEKSEEKENENSETAEEEIKVEAEAPVDEVDPAEVSEAAEVAEVVEVSPEVRQNKDDLASFLIMWLLVFVICFIFYRRLRKHYDFDLVTAFYALSS